MWRAGLNAVPWSIIPVDAMLRREPMTQASTELLGADTPADLQWKQVKLWRRMPALEKAQVVGQVSRRVRELSLAGIRQRHPSASEHECHLRYALLTLGRSLACRVYPEADTISGR